MKKIELLAPVGNMEALYAAIQNGCDAVYLGGEDFGARAFAKNFTREELRSAIQYAHVYGVRVYVTVNTLIHEDVLDEAIAYIQFLQDVDADACIIQDLGFMSVIRRKFPDMELHASTQMHVHNEQGIRFLKQQGVSRVVLPRETAIEELSDLSKIGLELEIFVQGALCVSYSGQCLMSSVLFQRSGNRGACAQPCRMQYQLHKVDQDNVQICPGKGAYLLSPKDLNTLDDIHTLLDAGVTSLKIEGRMKRPEYVAYMVSIYRKAIDAYVRHETFKVMKDMKEQMELLFHRGFTRGHVFHHMGSDLMNPLRPNHMGIEIGSIQSMQNDKMIISLTKALHQGDGIRILSSRSDEGFRVNRIYKQGRLVNSAQPFDIIALDRVEGVKAGDRIVKTSDKNQLKYLQASYQENIRKVTLQALFIMHKDECPKLIVNDGSHVISITSNIIAEKAIKTPLTSDRIQQQLNKTGNTPFQIENITCEIDEDATFMIRELNQMRREVMQQMERIRQTRHAKRRVLETKPLTPSCTKTSGIHVIVHTMDQYHACKHENIQLYIDGKALYDQISAFDDKVQYRTPRVMKKTYPKEGICQDIGGLYQETAMIYDTSLNLTNHETADFLCANGAVMVLFSLELNRQSCCRIATNSPVNYGYVVYGKRELMLSEYCVINAVEKDSNKQHCGLCKQHTYYLSDLKQRTFPILCDEDCRMHILEETAMNRISDMTELRKHHIENFVCVFTDEDDSTCKKILHDVIHKN